MTNPIVTCTSCQQPNATGSTTCAHCGVALQGSQAQTAGASQTQPPPLPPWTATPPPNPSSPPPHATLPPGIGEHPHSLTQRGFLASLFDTSFTSMVGTKLVRVLYVLTIVCVGLTALFYILIAFHQSSALGILVLLVVAPLMSLFTLGFARIVLEICIALFQIMADSNELVAQGRRKDSALQTSTSSTPQSTQ
jgi:hypothetical protein